MGANSLVVDDRLPAEIFMARQPIFSRDLDVMGYELLFRGGDVTHADVTDGNQATARLIVTTFLEIGLDRITDDKLAFINLTRDYLVGAIQMPFMDQQVVLEILEDVHIDAECIQAVAALARQGFCLALDDFAINERNIQLLPHVKIVKLDLMALEPDALRQHVEYLSRFPVKLLAEKVESQAQYQLCRDLGFDYFQGYFFARPRLLSAREIPPNQIAMLEVLALLQDPHCSFDAVDRIISQDIGISYKLLKIINSSFYGLNYRVHSIQHALVVLGLDTIKKWVTIMSLSMVPDKPPELIKLSLIRARMCEQSAPACGCSPQEAFTVGLFSLLDVLMDQPFQGLVERLPLVAEIGQALCDNAGPLGELLQQVIAYELGQWPDVGIGVGAGPSALPAHYLEALTWSREITACLH